jgi:hypothetical protein
MTRWKLCKTLTENFTMMHWIVRNKIEMVANYKSTVKFYDVNKNIDNLESVMRWVS